MSTDFSSVTEHPEVKGSAFNAEQVAKDLYEAIQHASNNSARALQAQKFRVGVSDLGFCSERTRRMIAQQVPEDTDVLAAAIGTAIGAWVEEHAVPVLWPHAIVQATVRVTLEGEERIYTLEGHPDVVLPEGVVIDLKTDYGLASVERSGPNQQQQFQRHTYAKGAWETGLFNDGVTLEDVQVANIWIDRAAIDKRLHVDMEPYNPDYVRGAAEWLDEVVYAHLNEEEAKKEPPRDMCRVACGFFRECRAFDTDVEGLIRDPQTVSAARLYREGLDLEKEAKRLKDQAKQHLSGVSGSTGEFTIRWTHVNESVVPERVRSAYDKLEIKPVPKPKEQP